MWAERPSQNENQSLLLQVEDFDFRYVARFWNQSASNVIAVENRAKISPFLTLENLGDELQNVWVSFPSSTEDQTSDILFRVARDRPGFV